MSDFPNKFPRRGEIYWAPAATKTRPVLVVSADIGNQHSNSVVVAALTSQIAAKLYPVNVRLVRGNPLAKAGEIRCRSLYEMRKDELKGYLGKLSEAQMDQVDTALKCALGLR